MMNMDTVMNKLRSTVSTVTSTVSQLSDYLPGNPVTREYDISQHIASGGPGLLWKIYSGTKKSTKEPAAVFIFEKKQLDRWSRKDRDTMIETLKKGVSQLTRLRHPRVLTVRYPLEESRDSLAFATEPVFASLANVLGCHENMPQPIPSTVRSYQLLELEIKYGLLQLCEGVTFLHQDAKMLHGNLCPESIIINDQNCWKLFGFDFALPGTINGVDVHWTCMEYDSEANPISQPHLDYRAPEYTTALSCSPASDLFSLGMLTYVSFNEGKPLFISGGNWHSHRQNLVNYNSLSESKLLCIPTDMRHFERRLLRFTPKDRPDVHEFTKLEYLHDEGVKTLAYLDSLFQRDNLQKSKFYKGLPDVLPSLPHRVRLHRVVPCIANDFCNPTMVPFVLPNVLKIAETSSNDEYVAHVLPHLLPVMKYREPVQILFIFMKYMELLLQKTPPDVTKSDVLPLIYGSLESDSPQVQELCLAIIPSFAGLLDYNAMKNALMPRIRKLCISTSSLSVRVNCLVCLGKLLENLDKWLVMDFVLPFLTEIPSREPAVIMGIIGIYRLAVTHKKLGVTKEVIATKMLPFIFPLCIENGLSTQQFSTILNFVYELIKIIETEQKAKLEEVDAITRERQQIKAEMNNHPEYDSKLDNMFDGMSMSMPSKSPSHSQSMSTFPSAISGGGDVKLSPVKANNAMIPPKPAQQSKTNHAPKDLTATLMESQFKQISLPSSASMPSINPNPYSNLSSNSSNTFMSPMQNNGMSPAPMFNNPAIQPMTSNFYGSQQMTTPFGSGMAMGGAPQSMPFNQNPMMGSAAGPRPVMGMGMGSASMQMNPGPNIMQAQLQPKRNTNNAGNNMPGLSKKDIDDFLS